MPKATSDRDYLDASLRGAVQEIGGHFNKSQSAQNKRLDRMDGRLDGLDHRIDEGEQGDIVSATRERSLRLGHVLRKRVDWFIYEYDMGDSWEHAVFLEDSLVPIAGREYLSVIGGKRACPRMSAARARTRSSSPPWRSRGTPGAESFCVRLGGSFDAEAFDLGEVNDALHGSG